MQQSHSADEYRSPFPNPWEYQGVPMDDMRDLYQLYQHVYLDDVDMLTRAMDMVMHNPDSKIGQQHIVSQGQDAHMAAQFFIICDFVAMKYARFHPTFKVKPIPQEVLNYLRYPYNQMTSLDIEDQRRFKASLPPEQQEAVFIDD